MGKRKKQVKCSICHLKGKNSSSHCKKCNKHHALSEECCKSLIVDYFEPKKKSKTPQFETLKATSSLCIPIEESKWKLKDNKKKNLGKKSSTTNYYKISNNFKKIDNYYKSTSKNTHYTEKKKQVLTSTYARYSKQKYTKERDSTNKVSILQNRNLLNLSAEEVLKVKFYFNNQFKLLVPISREN